MEDLKKKGNEAVAKGDFQKAADFYAEAFKFVQPGSEAAAALHSNRSYALLKFGKATQAAEEAGRAVTCRPEWNKGHFRLGEALFALEDFDGAEKAFARAHELAPDDAHVRGRLQACKEANSGYFFRQLFAGRDFAVGTGGMLNFVQNQVFSAAQQMRNFSYLVGDTQTRECVVVDPAWDVKAILARVEAEHMKLVGAIATHYHFDHTGGLPPPPFDSLGIRLAGVKEVAEQAKVPVYVHRDDAATIREKNRVPASSIHEVQDEETLRVGRVELKFLHTPGHTPGSMCVRIKRTPDDATGALLSGDTLFIGSCGRLDLPDCDQMAMYSSLQRKLATLPDDTRVYPGHDYGGKFTTIGSEKARGLLRPLSEGQWKAMHSKI
ncbi:hypothetical protein KFL_004560160 [Klebsormidium nitens]|uniref:Metallo-beta-lactamase domain-containing protein n=1 Tax=Klebsormidium nitens TaxID=105231 RepID=A0A1Y1ICR8_KLENI|nr:hypothetical protein KFL_004560160 [Klebsormidium nitens]|eukprot:GAQ88755.1 hypothetical protein KFL_004560160 [Klebsormidium nitens]